MCNRHRTGFTLIELLVVIAIIAILAAILFPIFTKAKASAQRSACMNNLKQLSLAAQNYTDSWNGNYPPAYMWHWPWGDWNDDNGALGMRALIPYVKNKKVFFCPANLYFTHQHYNEFWKTNMWWCGYSYWGNWLQPDVPSLTSKQIAMNTGHDPYSLLLSDIVCTSDTGAAHPFNSHPSGGLPEGGNFVCNDGHAKWKWRTQMKVLATWSSVTFYW